MLLSAFVSLVTACGSAPAPAVERMDPAMEKLVKEQVNDLSGIPVLLTAQVVGVEGAPGAGAPTVAASETGTEIDITISNAPICAADGAEAAASRSDMQITVAVTGGTPCAAGQVGKVTLHTTDRPGSLRGRHVSVVFGTVTADGEITRTDAPNP